MYKVLIAEDELLTRAGIVSTVNWEELGMKLVAQASDGEQALRLYRAHHPEIVITDLNMPRLSGVDLIAKISEERLPCKILVITCVDDVQTIKKLFPYRIFDFLMKSSISAQELQQKLLAARKELDEQGLVPEQEEAVQTDSQLLRMFLDGEIAALPFPVSPYCWMFQLREQNGSRLLLSKTVAGLVAEYFTSYSETVIDCRDQLRFMVCFRNENLDQEIILQRVRQFQKYCWKALNQELLCNVEFCRTPEEMRQRWAVYFDMIRHVRVLDEGVFENQTAYFGKRITDLQKLFEFNLFSGEVRRIYRETLVADIAHVLSDGPPAFSVYRQAAADGFEKFCTALALFPAEETARRVQEILCLQTYEGVCLFIHDILESQSDVLCMPDCGHAEIQKSIQYIRENCASKITLNTAAEAVSFSPSYFSTLFKRAMGVSFINYLIDFRVNRAMELLKNEDMFLYEIADQTGIPDISHFSKTFKAATGYSPNSWRKLRYLDSREFGS